MLEQMKKTQTKDKTEVMELEKIKINCELEMSQGFMEITQVERGWA